MLGDASIICFAATADAHSTRAFYQGVLDLTLVEESPFALVFDARGVVLRIQIVANHTAPNHTSIGWSVDNLDAVIDGLSKRGVLFLRYEGMDQDARNVWTSPSGARVAWFRDPAGNTLSLTEEAR